MAMVRMPFPDPCRIGKAHAVGPPKATMQMLDTECAKATMGASFAIVTGGALTLFIAAPPHGTSVWVRVVDEVSDAVFEQEITADLPASTQFPSPWLYMNYGAIAAAVA